MTPVCMEQSTMTSTAKSTTIQVINGSKLAKNAKKKFVKRKYGQQQFGEGSDKGDRDDGESFVASLRLDPSKYFPFSDIAFGGVLFPTE